ncbi:MAG: GHKL domain-containing protein [Lachnospiraceae bacterium]|nr:GHKL domain-containing protein [Lachnospiraceae bacterium]
MKLPFIMYTLSGWWSFLFGNIIMLLMMRFRYPMKKTVPLALFLIPLSVFDLWIYYLFGSETGGQLFLVINTIPSLLLFFYLSDYRDGRFLFTFFFSKTITSSIILFTNLADAFFTSDSHILLALLRFILYPVVLFILIRFVRESYFLVQEKLPAQWLLFGILSALFYITILLFFNFPTTLSKRPIHIPVFFLIFVVMILTYVSMFRMIYQTVTIYEARERENLLTIETSSLMGRLKEFEEKNEALAIYRHDERHRLQQLSAMLIDGRVNEAADFLVQTDKVLSEAAIRHFCSDPIIDAVLSFYAESAEREGIPFFFRGDVQKQGLEGTEMFPIVIANALENALHANQKIRDKADRFIRIALISKPQRMLRVENPLPEGTVFDREGFPISGRQGGDKQHGIGVKSIRAFAKKHDAALYYQVETRDGSQTLVMTMIG